MDGQTTHLDGEQPAWVRRLQAEAALPKYLQILRAAVRWLACPLGPSLHLPSSSEVNAELRRLRAQVQEMRHAQQLAANVWAARATASAGPDRQPDPAWPHPEGRPCIDVAAPVRQEA
jgi:hypothetical protein